MKPNLLVLSDSSAAAERARAYAAVLAAPLGAEVHLVHVYPVPPMNTRVGLVMHATNAHYVRRQRHALEDLAAAMPVPATATTTEGEWDDTVQAALDLHRPLLLIAGLTATDGKFDEWLSNRCLNLAHETGYPLLLVPQHLPVAALRAPRCLALAVPDQYFELAPEATAVAPLLNALGTRVVPVTVLPPDRPTAGQRGLAAAQACGLAAGLATAPLHRVVGEDVAAGIRQALDELPADVLTLLDPGHGWVNKLFGGSVIDKLLRHTQVPVLLLATQEAGLD
jgi:nucleotide-binding universal stress UspA family protein